VFKFVVINLCMFGFFFFASIIVSEWLHSGRRLRDVLIEVFNKVKRMRF
jgi:hypothetical protein